jgi:hypothetical protein
MNYANEILLYLLEQIKSEADLTPEKTPVEKEAIRQLQAQERPESDQIVESTKARAYVRLAYPIERIIYLSENKAKKFEEKFGREMEKILKVFKNKEIILYFLYPYNPASKDPYKMNKKIDPYYGIILPENFDEMYEKYKKIYSPENETSQKPPEKISDEKEGKNKKKYWIDYTKSREVILNSKYIINVMQFSRPSDYWFDYIFKNSNIPISLEKIKNETKKDVRGGFNKLLNNINFTGQLRKLFFKQGKCGIIFYNPITEKDLGERVSLDVKKLKKEIKKLKKI